MGDLPDGYLPCTDPDCEANQMPVNPDGTRGYRHAHPEGSTWRAGRDEERGRHSKDSTVAGGRSDIADASSLATVDRAAGDSTLGGPHKDDHQDESEAT